MKTLIPFLLLLPFICFGQVPQSMSYQAMAMDDNGFEISNSQISIQVSIIEETPSGLVSFVEEHTVTTDAFGMFSINIGQGNSDDDYSSVDWSKSNFLRVELDDNMDGAYSLMGVSAFNSVPYSYMAENVMNPEDLMDNLGDHNATQTLDMDSNYVSQVLAPELPLDAANKQYVDDMIGDITTGAGEIVHYYISTESNVETLDNCFTDECAIIKVVPENKIIHFTHKVSRHNTSWSNQEPNSAFITPYLKSKKLNISFGPYETSTSGNKESRIWAFPGDTIYFERNPAESYLGFFYQYTVSETQIDENSTSYSMVSLDEGASSSGGTINEGTGGSSSQGGYMISEVSEEEMGFHNALSYCRNLEEAGYTDWYLPTLDEILDIKSGRNENDQIFPDDSSQFIWTQSVSGYEKIYRIRISNSEIDSQPAMEHQSTICIRK